MKKIVYFFFLSITAIACIGDDIIDDFVQPTIRVVSAPQSLAQGDTFKIEAILFGDTGEPAASILEYSTDNPNIASIDQSGFLVGMSKGEVNVLISAIYNEERLSSEITVTIDEITIEVPKGKKGVVETTSTYPLHGSFTINPTETGIVIEFGEDYIADTSLSGLFVYLTNNSNTNVNAFEIGRVTVFQGQHTYEIEGVGVEDYSHLLYFCKPFSVKVGDAEIVD